MVASRDIANRNVRVVDCHSLEVTASLHDLGPLGLERGDPILRRAYALVRQKFLYRQCHDDTLLVEG